MRPIQCTEVRQIAPQCLFSHSSHIPILEVRFRHMMNAEDTHKVRAENAQRADVPCRTAFCWSVHPSGGVAGIQAAYSMVSIEEDGVPPSLRGISLPWAILDSDPSTNMCRTNSLNALTLLSCRSCALEEKKDPSVQNFVPDMQITPSCSLIAWSS